MRTKREKVIEVLRDGSVGDGRLPAYINLGFRHLEKEASGPTVLTDRSLTYLIPTDLLRLQDVLPPGAADEIDSVEITFRRKGTA